MDNPDTKRRKKDDKKKEKFQRNAGKSSQHTRNVEALLQKRSEVNQTNIKKK
jgi:hypothetical protein